MRVGGVDPATAQERSARAGGAEPSDDKGLDHPRNQAKPHLRQGEEGAIAGDDDVAGRSEADAATHRGAVDTGDGRFAAGREAVEDRAHRPGVAVVLVFAEARRGGHPAQVGTSAEGFALTR